MNHYKITYKKLVNGQWTECAILIKDFKVEDHIAFLVKQGNVKDIESNRI